VSFRARLTALMLVCLAISSVVVARAIYIQLVRDDRVETLARRQFQSRVLIRPRRGTIVDRNGEALAVNAEIQSLAANPSRVTGKHNLVRLLARALEMPQGKLLERMSGKREFMWIKRHLTEGELARLRKFGLFGSDGELVSGLWLVKESKRVYPHNELASQVLGDVNLDSEGLEGVELWGNQKLQGKVVSVSAIKDALGRPTFIDAAAAKQVHDGEQVALTLDASLQYSAEQELRSAVARHGARGGSVIVMNAVNGEILAMANEPSFNANARHQNVASRRNRAVTDGYEPGSTLKAVLLSAALSQGMRLGDRLWAEKGSFVVQGKRISEAEAHEKFEWISLKQMIQLSSNVAAAKLALKVGSDRYLTTLKSFGFGEKTDLGFPGEISGIVPPRPARGGWQPLTLANVGFGQGILVTPMQMVRAYAAFLNGGWLVQPTLWKTPLRPGAVERPRRILSQRTADQVVEALKSVTVDKGTGLKAALEGYTVAGKTGTAQAVDPATGKYSRSRYIASFIGFAVNVDPKLVIFTSIDEPRGVYYASETAAPLFKQVLNAAATRFSLPAQETPSRVLAMAQSGPPGRKAKAPSAGLSDRLTTSLAKVVPAESDRSPAWIGNQEDGQRVWKMPALKGLTPREALKLLGGRKFKVELHGNGLVKGQIPEEGRPMTEGSTLKLVLAEP
jgi:cell division protein FtsI (penicillin-binding protein 3)